MGGRMETNCLCVVLFHANRTVIHTGGKGGVRADLGL